jgi:enediyne biosynthesis protein E11
MTERDVIADLTAEAGSIDELLLGRTDTDWARPTPATGWTVADQIAHLTFIFRLAGTAASDPELFGRMASAAGDDFEGAVNAALQEFRGDSPDTLVAKWQTQRDSAIKSLADVPPDEVVPWLVRPLPPAVLACAGFMEAFAHGQDVADALGVRRTYTDRIWNLAWFATLTWDFGYQSRGETAPDVQLRYELTAPSGEVWTFGPEDSAERIIGSAADFCLLVTRRRHRDDLDVTAEGEHAEHWLDIAQAYRGPAGEGRRPGQFD